MLIKMNVVRERAAVTREILDAADAGGPHLLEMEPRFSVSGETIEEFATIDERTGNAFALSKGILRLGNREIFKRSGISRERSPFKLVPVTSCPGDREGWVCLQVKRERLMRSASCPERRRPRADLASGGEVHASACCSGGTLKRV